MRRTVVASVVLAAAIATPGIVVAAMSSRGHSHSASLSYTSGIIVTPVTSARTPPIDPTLRPAVRAVRRAFASRGIELVVVPVGPREAEAVQLSAALTSGRCPIVVHFQHVAAARPPTLVCKEGSGSVTAAGVRMTYIPRAIGPTVEQAAGTLR